MPKEKDVEMRSSVYKHRVFAIKKKIQKMQVKAALQVNQTLLHLYRDIGKSISQKIAQAQRGDRIVDELAKELQRDFPTMKGFSRSNLFAMKSRYEFYREIAKVQQLVGQIPRGHNILIIQKFKDKEEALFYVKKTIENNRSRNVLWHQADVKLYQRQGKAITNFTKTLPQPQSDLANDILKDPYTFDFLTLKEQTDEKNIEEQLVSHITSFLLELGAGFTFVARQYRLHVGEQDFWIDLLLYHIRLRCYVVVELKATQFKPEHVGQLNFYLSAVDDLVKSTDDKPTIGLLLCKSKNKIQAEYALQGIQKPIGVAEYELLKAIPEELKSQLPSIEDIEKELATIK